MKKHTLRLSILMWAASISTLIMHGSFLPSTGSTSNRISISGLLDKTTDANNAYLLHLLGDSPVNQSSTEHLKTHGFEHIVLARFTVDGAIDTSFNSTGQTQIDDTNFSGLSGPTHFIPTKIIHTGSTYIAVSSTRHNGTESSNIAITGINASDGSVDYASILPPHANLVAAYTNNVTGSNNKALYRINDVTVDGSVAYIAGTICEDPDGEGSYKNQAFVGAITMSGTPSWSMAPVIISDTNENVHMTHVALQGTKLFAAGFTDSKVFVREYDTTNNLAQIGVAYEQSGTGDVSAALGVQNDNPVLVVSKANTSDPILQEAISIQRLEIDASNNITGNVDTTFAESGFRNKNFDDVPVISSMHYDTQYPAYHFVNNDVSIQFGFNNEIFVAGSISDQALPFVYKLDANGAEIDYALNKINDVNDNGELVEEFAPSAVLYPVIGINWSGEVHFTAQAIIDNAANWLYLFGVQGSAHRNVDTNQMYNIETDDLIRRVTTGNLTITANLDNLIMSTVYSGREIQLHATDNVDDVTNLNPEVASNIVGATNNISFENFKLYSTVARFTTAAQHPIETVYGTVEVTRNTVGTGQRNVHSEIVTIEARNITGGDDNRLVVNIGGGTSPADPFRIYDTIPSPQISENPSRTSGAVIGGKLIGQMSDGTNLEFNIQSLQLVETEVLVIGNEIKGDGYVKLTNNYSHEQNTYTLTLDNDLFKESTNDATTGLKLLNSRVEPAIDEPVSVKKMELDLVENPTTGEQNIFGYLRIYSDKFTPAPALETNPANWISFPVYGVLKQSLVDNQLDGDFEEGNIDDLDAITGSYLQGWSPYGRVTVALKRAENYTADPQDHVEIRTDVALEIGAKLTITNAYNSTAATLTLDSQALSEISDLHPDFAITESTIELEGESGVSRSFANGQQHVMRIAAQLPVQWLYANQTTTIPVGGDLRFIVSRDGTIKRPDNFILKGVLQEGIHLPITVYVRVHDFEITQSN